jgi:hypothetical protein
MSSASLIVMNLGTVMVNVHLEHTTPNLNKFQKERSQSKKKEVKKVSSQEDQSVKTAHSVKIG